MTVETTNSTISYTGNNSVTTFAYNFLTYSEDHLFIYLDDVEQTSGFSVDGVGDESGGDIIFNIAPGDGVEIRIDRTVPETQLIEYQEYGPFKAKTNERGLDLGVMIAQQNAREIGRDSSKKMDKQPLAMEDNIVTFDDEGNSKDSGVNLNSSGVITDLNKVIPFDTLDEAVNETNPLKMFDGAAMNLSGRGSKDDGYGGMWDAYPQGTFPLGNNVVASNFFPLQLVKRKDSSVSTRSIAEAKTRFIAHRGMSTIAPENTIAAYRLAANAGFWAGECDVQVTSDGQWVLMHDDTVDRTTNGTGLVKSMTLAQIKALDAGSWFSSYYTGETVPTLSEYLSLCKEKGLNPFIEIKTDMYTDANLILLLDTLNQYFPDSSAIIATFDEDILLRIRGFDTKVNLQYFTLNYTNSAVDFAVRLGNCGLAVQQPGLGSDLSYAVENMIYIMVWTVNEFDTMNAALNTGASQILTDFILGEPS